MCKKKYLLLLLLITSVSFSQKTGTGSINYKATIKKSVYNKKIDAQNEKLIKLYNIIKSQTDKGYVLYFKNEESIFKGEPKMKNDASNEFDAVSIIAGDGVYYYDFLKNEILLQEEILGENFIIKDLKYKWKFTQETKKIGSYLCYKATTVKNIVNRKGIKFKRPIVAWYTLELPIKFGVKDYVGLPGATIVLEEPKVTFTATKINFNDSKVEEIKKPIKGKLVTQEELNSFIKENMYRN